jgi:hypothetical protein
VVPDLVPPSKHFVLFILGMLLFHEKQNDKQHNLMVGDGLRQLHHVLVVLSPVGNNECVNSTDPIEY